MQQHLPVAAATVELSPAFQSRESNRIVVLVAERRLTPNCKINRRSATENGYGLGDPALKSRAKLTWSLRRPGRRLLHLFLKDHQPTVGPNVFFASRQRRLNPVCVPNANVDSTVADATRWRFAPLPRIENARLNSRRRCSGGRSQKLYC